MNFKHNSATVKNIHTNHLYMKRILFTLIPLCLVFVVKAQTLSPQVISTAGDYFEVPGVGSLSWTLGEPVVETFTGTAGNVILTQGFQQPEDFGVGITEVKAGNLFANLYPNPTLNDVTLDLTYDQTAILELQIVDLLGRVLYEAELDVVTGQMKSFNLDISSLVAGMYLVRVTDNGQVVDTYRVQKATR